MDPGLVERLAGEGRLPNLARLIAAGGFHRLGTSDPPQSPVAWSNFIAGTDPGGHGIYDFIARDPATLKPFLSTSRVDPVSRHVDVGKWTFPVTGGTMRNLRRGPAVWGALERAGIPCTVLRMPANFPPSPAATRALSGLGTPDVHGGYGLFAFYTDRIGERTRDVSSGHIERVRVADNAVHAALPGPANDFCRSAPRVDVPFDVWLDPDAPAARLRIQEHDLLLREGEWSGWLRLSFRMVPGIAQVRGICRFFLKHAREDFELYASPVHLDPADPVLPISSPAGYAADLARRLGSFHTMGMSEATGGLSAGVLTDPQYREQALSIHEESERLLDAEFGRFRDGFLFAYFSTLDLNSHVFWRALDPQHPLYTAELARDHGDFLPDLYGRLDRIVGRVLAACGPDTLFLALSDHGFTSFRRQFNLNTWLLENGYAKAAVPEADRGRADFFGDIRWGDTRAYGLGINSLYVNLRGREPDGCVGAGDERERLLAELAARLEAAVDPETGEHPIRRAYRPGEIYHGPCVADAPDLVIGYNPGYRASWDTVLGKYPTKVFLDNRDPWSGDHCMDRAFMDGVLFSSRPLVRPRPTLCDLAPSVLAAFGVPAAAGMTGRNLWNAAGVARQAGG
jgi:predicted AlkP superfamily phosphohydrolase/phosphomutase